MNKNLSSEFPQIAAEWDYLKNEKAPQDYAPYSHKEVYFKCEMEHSFKFRISSRTRDGYNCPYCAKKRPSKEYNLITEFPMINQIWDYDKNKLPPEEYLPKSEKFAYFKCEKGHSHHAKIRNKTKFHKCPECEKINNSITNKNPELASEWSNKNTASANEVGVGAREKFLWLCSKCNHEWAASVTSRNHDLKGCPKCQMSKGERKIIQYLKDRKIEYKSQFKFKNSSIKNLRFDFKFEINGILVLVEYQGEQHFEIGNFSKDRKSNITSFEKLKINDQLKRDFCSENGCFLQEIPFWRYNEIDLYMNAIIEACYL